MVNDVRVRTLRIEKSRSHLGCRSRSRGNYYIKRTPAGQVTTSPTETTDEGP